MLRPCATPGCPELVTTGHCDAHKKQIEQKRGSASARGYGVTWRSFREWFINRLIAAGIVPCCGAALPGGPSMAWSRCRAEGRLTTDELQLDHDPPLRADERRDRRAVEDWRRVGLLCRACHSRKTLAETASAR